jgi:hypothetical protein
MLKKESDLVKTILLCINMDQQEQFMYLQARQLAKMVIKCISSEILEFLYKYTPIFLEINNSPRNTIKHEHSLDNLTKNNIYTIN